MLQQKAEDLGHIWNKELFPTPIWQLETHKMCYTLPPFNISRQLWDRELMLWAADSAERVICKVDATELEMCKQTLKVVRDFANGKAKIGDLDLAFETTLKLGKNPKLETHNQTERYFALWSINYATRYSERGLSENNSAHYATRYAAISLNEVLPAAIKANQIKLFKRIDCIAPWASETSLHTHRVIHP